MAIARGPAGAGAGADRRGAFRRDRGGREDATVNGSTRQGTVNDTWCMYEFACFMQSFTSKGIGRQGMFLFVENSHVPTLCPVVLCTYLCTSVFCALHRPNARWPSFGIPSVHLGSRAFVARGASVRARIEVVSRRIFVNRVSRIFTLSV